jgi:cytochrome c553
MMARSLDDADLLDIAAYFAAEPVRPSKGPVLDAAARQLFEQGDARRKIIACATCHGANAQGGGAAGPVLRGQGQHYLAQQLHEWRSGTRKNSAGGIMNQQAAPLTDAEIAALARYLSSL